MWCCCCFFCIKIIKYIPKKLLILVIVIDLLLKDFIINFIINGRNNKYNPNTISQISIIIAIIFFQAILLSLIQLYQIYSFQQIKNFNYLYEKFHNSLFKSNITSRLTKKVKINDIKYIVTKFYEDYLWKIIQLILFLLLTSFLMRLINAYFNISYSLYYFGLIFLSYCVFLSFKLNHKTIDNNNNTNNNNNDDKIKNENLKKKTKKKIKKKI